jgi:hypothetical protein
MHTYKRCCCGIKLVIVKKELKKQIKKVFSLDGCVAVKNRRRSALEFFVTRTHLHAFFRGGPKTKIARRRRCEKVAGALDSKIAKNELKIKLLFTCVHAAFVVGNCGFGAGPVCIFENRHARRCKIHTLNRIFGPFIFLFDIYIRTQLQNAKLIAVDVQRACWNPHLLDLRDRPRK